MKRKFEEAFTLPFKGDSFSEYINDSSGQFCLQMAVQLSPEVFNTVIRRLNSDKSAVVKNKYVYNDQFGIVTMNGRPFIVIRGWGYLTGVFGLDLSDKEASSIQRSLGKYIVNRLNYKP